jgi:hypothetical protein
MLELKKMQLERMKVECAKQEMELRIFEREEEIQRLRDNIKLQDKRINELTDAIESIKGE